MYYTAKVKLEHDAPNGKTKTTTETYLVESMSVTEAEARVHEDFKSYNQDFEVTEVRQSKIIKVLDSSN